MAPVWSREGVLAAHARLRAAVTTREPLAWPALALLVVAPALAGGAPQSLVLSGVAVVLAAALVAATAPHRVPVLVRVRTVQPRAEGQAPTPSWCTVEVPERPIRPRAPGRR